MATNKEQGINIGINQFITYVTLIPILWFIVQPLLLDAMAGDIRKIVAEQSEPIQDAFAVLLLRDINSLRKEIAALEFRQRRAEDWAASDAEYLASLEIELEALTEARKKLEKGE